MDLVVLHLIRRLEELIFLKKLFFTLKGSEFSLFNFDLMKNNILFLLTNIYCFVDSLNESHQVALRKIKLKKSKEDLFW